MGLDMYFYLKRYERCSTFDDDFEERKKGFYPSELEVFVSDYMYKKVSYEIGYLRKVNAIHKWIVDNCAYGEDNCRDIYISYIDVRKLYNTIVQVLENHRLAKDLLPTSDGFFFGTQEYDESYYKNLEYMKELLEKVESFERSDYDFVYRASW